MKLLLDTHVWLWLQVAPERLGDALEHAEDAANTLLFSAASAWEIAIKWRFGKLPLPEPPSRYPPSRMRTSGVYALPITHAHAAAVAELPDHHRDSFDRLLIAQAVAENSVLVSADEVVIRYDVAVLHAG